MFKFFLLTVLLNFYVRLSATNPEICSWIGYRDLSSTVSHRLSYTS